LGRVSYGAYLFHHFIHFQTLQAILGPFGVSWTPPQSMQILTEFVVTIVLSAISWVVLERPILDWAAKITRRKPFSPSGPSGAMARPEAASAGLTGDLS
jgi:peptidoglycan/LPS O-acetylase OafA/YrhL